MARPFNEWVKIEWQREIESRGGCCQECGALWPLEFAHVRPTKCVGKGRGKYRRLRDIRRYPKRYKLLCMGCHDVLDGRPYRRRQPEIRKGL